MKTLVLFAHPRKEKSHANKAIIAALSQESSVTIRDLYALYPEFVIDVQAEQEALIAADLIIFQFPFYWYSTPALLKQWMDDVLSYGFAYGSTGTALQGKKLLISTTTGGGFIHYQPGQRNNFSVFELLRPLQQTATLCKMEYLTPCVFYSALPQGDAYTPSQKQELSQHSKKLLETISA